MIEKMAESSWREAKEAALRQGLPMVYHDLETGEYGACRQDDQRGHFDCGKFVKHNSIVLSAELSPEEMTAQERGKLVYGKEPVGGEEGRAAERYMADIWLAKTGSEEALATALEEFSVWTLEHEKGLAGAFVLGDTDRPGRFITLGPWKDDRSIRAWRTGPEYREFLARVERLCEAITPGTMAWVAPGRRSR